MQKEATISDNQLYRYKLSRTWDSTKPTILFIGLNPSIADETIDDPTITRCINYAKAWGYGTLLMTNLFAFRSTYPKDIYLVDDPIGDENDNYILECVAQSDLVVACWGNNGMYMNRILYPIYIVLEKIKTEPHIIHSDFLEIFDQYHSISKYDFPKNNYFPETFLFSYNRHF